MRSLHVARMMQGKTIPCYNPATGQLLGEDVAPTAEEVCTGHSVQDDPSLEQRSASLRMRFTARLILTYLHLLFVQLEKCLQAAKEAQNLWKETSFDERRAVLSKFRVLL